MSKWYEVKVTTVKIVAVEIEDNTTDDEARDAAMAVALEEAPMSGANEAEVVGGPYIAGDVLESVLRHADEEWPL